MYQAIQLIQAIQFLSELEFFELTNCAAHTIRLALRNDVKAGSLQQIRYLGVFPLKISPEIKHYAREEVNNQWEADGKK